MEWTVVEVIIALLAFLGAVFALSDRIKKPIEELNNSIVRLDTTMTMFQEQCKENKTCNDEEHIAIWDAMEKQGDKLSEHDTEIAVLKEKVG